MDNSNHQQSYKQTDHLGVNKIGKNIKKSPSHQPNFSSPARQQPQPQVYNINRKDFRDIVQQLTSSPSREPPPRLLQNQPRAPNNRLQRVRPPPLAPTRGPHTDVHPHHSRILVPAQAHRSVPVPYTNNFTRPPPPRHDHQPSPTAYLPSTPTDIWTNTTESPISAYMRYLQNSIIDSRPQQPQFQPQLTDHNLPQPFLHPNSVMMPLLPSPRVNAAPPNLQSPRFACPPPPLASPRVNGPPLGLPSPRMHVSPSHLTSPTSQFLLPSPTSFWNILSPRSPYPLLSPGYQHPPPFSPNFSFSPVFRPGILGPGPLPPPSPGYGFPLSPSGFPLSPSGFPLYSPIWRI